MRKRANDEKLTSVIECIVIRKTRTKSSQIYDSNSWQKIETVNLFSNDESSID